MTELRHIRRTIRQGEAEFLCGLVVAYESADMRWSLPPQAASDVLPSNTCPACLENHRKKYPLDVV